MKTKLIAVVLLIAMLLTSIVACKGEKNDPGSTTAGTTNTFTTIPPATTRYPEHVDPPAVPSTASKYSGTPDTAWFTGDKTEYTLTTADQLVGFQELRSETCDFEGVTIKLGVDVILNDSTVEQFSQGGEGVHSWRQLNSAWLFKGTFDGQGHVISGLYMQLTANAVRGMFGGVGGNAVIKNFTLVNSYFGGPSANKNTLGSIIAKVAGENSKVTLSNVVSFATVKGGDGTLGQVGGLVGAVNDGADLTVENCGFHGNIDVSGYYAGGILGFVEHKQSNITLISCHNSADITTTRYAGGLMGICVANAATVIDCGNTGKLTSLGSGDLCPVFSSYVDPNPYTRPAAPDGTTVFRVMSFNVQNDVDLSGITPSANGSKRMEGVLTEINAYAPDFLGLQEDGPHWNMYFSDQLSDYHVIMDYGVSGEACAIYYKKGITMLDSGYGWATSTGKNGSVALTVADITDPSSKYYMTPEERSDINITDSSDDAVFTTKMYRYKDEKTGEYKNYEDGYTLLTCRRFSYGVFELNGQQVIYVNTHLTHRSPNAAYYSNAFAKVRSLERIKELEIIQNTIDQVKAQYPNAEVVITGDMNDEFGMPIYEAFYNLGYESAHANTLNKFGPAGSWNNAFDLNKQGSNYPNTDKEATSHEYLDYCFVTDGVSSLKFVSGDGKATIAGGTTVYTSDHLPIIADLGIKTDKTGSFIDPNYKDPNAGADDDMSKPSVYNGLPDTTWFTKDKKEYTLTNARELMGFFYLRSANTDFSGITIKLARDVIINEGTAAEMQTASQLKEFYQFNSAYEFKGIFDGQGHSISGVYLHPTSSCVRGIFGTLGTNSAIKNLTIKHAYIDGPTATGKNRLGVLTPQVNGTGVVISDVHIEDLLMTGGSGNVSDAGGMIGRVNKNCSVTIENSSVSGSIQAPNSARIGGFVGSAQSNGKITIKNSTTDLQITAASYGGGLVGSASSSDLTITNSKANGKVTCSGAAGAA